MRALVCFAAFAGVLGSIACGSSSGSGGSAGSGATSSSAGSGNVGNTGAGGSPVSTGGSPNLPTGPSSAAGIAQKLGKSNFLIGLGNDLDPGSNHDMDGAFRVGTQLDLHYVYLSAYKNADGSWGSWASWNPNGTFVDLIAGSADAHGTIPMFTLYAMAEQGDGNVLGEFTSDSFQKSYWADVKLLFQRLGVFGKPAFVHIEPDFWAYAEQQTKEDPTSKVNLTANVPDCAGLTNDVVGFGHCYVLLARKYAPQALIGFHASEWANADPMATVKFLNAVGADATDVVFADLLDRDAGCFEAGTDPVCMRQGSFYWDENNQTSPNFHEYLAWSKSVAGGLQHPLVWWQIPLGVPSTTKGGTSGHYRDNRVHYIFSHISEFVDAGGLGVAFGVGADHQTTIDTDGGQFKNAVAGYAKAPVALPK